MTPLSTEQEKLLVRMVEDQLNEALRVLQLITGKVAQVTFKNDDFLKKQRRGEDTDFYVNRIAVELVDR